MSGKIYYTMGEVAEMFDVRPSLLRHWEREFDVLRPKRNNKGNRLYRPEDIGHLKQIYHLVKEQGMTLDGAKRALRRRRGLPEADRDAELLERLLRVRTMLAEVREELKLGDGDPAEEPEPSEEACGGAEMPRLFPDGGAQTATVRRGRDRAVVKYFDDEADAPDAAAGESPEGSAPERRTRQRRRGDECAPRELFAFYEQSLF